MSFWIDGLVEIGEGFLRFSLSRSTNVTDEK